MNREEYIKKAIMLGVKYETLTLDIVKNGLNVDEITARIVLDLMVSKDYLIDFDYEGDEMNLLPFNVINELFKNKDNRKDLFDELCKIYDSIEVDEKLKPFDTIDKVQLSKELKQKVEDWVKRQDRIGLGVIEKEFNVNIYSAVEIINYLIHEKMIVKNNLQYDVI